MKRKNIFTIDNFFDIKLPKGDLKEGFYEEGEHPLITSGVNNFGILGYTNGKSTIGDQYDSVIFDGNCITLDMFCNAFYREKPFYAVSHGRINVLTPKIDLNKFHLLYICTLLNYEQFRFSYGRAVYSNVAKKMLIEIPVKDDNISPDWDYIEDFIKQLPYADKI